MEKSSTNFWSEGIKIFWVLTKINKLFETNVTKVARENLRTPPGVVLRKFKETLEKDHGVELKNTHE